MFTHTHFRHVWCSVFWYRTSPNAWLSLQPAKVAKNCTRTERGMDNFNPFNMRAVKISVSDLFSSPCENLYIYKYSSSYAWTITSADKHWVRDATWNCREQRGALDYRRTSSSLIKLRVDSTPGVRCNEKPISQSHRNFFHRENGAYKIDAGPGKVIVYCVLSDSHGCGRGGYTLVMKLDGKKASVTLSSLPWEPRVT